MRRFYITSPGRLRRKENTIYYEVIKEEKEIDKIPLPVEDISAIYLFGETDLNTKVLNYLSQYDIPVHIFNYYGYYSGTFLPRKKNISGNLIILQAKHYIDEEKRLYLAKKFIEGAVFHIKRNLREYKIDISEILELEKSIDTVNSIPELMAIEGNIRNIYYQKFNLIIENPDFYIYKRDYNPPSNPINALISFGNSIIYSVVLTEIYRTHLEPSISYLHSPSEKRFSLSLDIAEIFKPFIVDPLIFKLINTGALKINHFDRDLNFSYLNEEGRKIFLKNLEDKLENSTVKHRTLSRNVSYRYLIRLECYKLIKHLLEEQVYTPFKAWW
ncbi:MAG: type I-B CRISPR-associated endonuclease Cas1b [Hydrogenothermaceae bacterium]|nr:type I-B CRISPR-associated endonuclease Cas1b [Hydrogenothermaceae bacterium]